MSNNEIETYIRLKYEFLSIDNNPRWNYNTLKKMYPTNVLENAIRHYKSKGYPVSDVGENRKQLNKEILDELCRFLSIDTD